MTAKPSIVYILADDLGYGDLSCFNPEGKIPTPNLDKLASQGMVFTDAHASSSVCTPSRYGVLTGRYNWRSRLQAGIVCPYEEPLIAADRLTVPALLGQHGYHSACVGKWHLGWDWPFDASEEFLPGTHTPAAPVATEANKGCWRDAFSKPIAGGPTTRGFDTYFGVDVPNWPPYCFIENDHTVGIPQEWLPAKLLGNNQASLPGPALPGWQLERILPALADRACRYITDRHAEASPFFLYMPLTSPHTPLAINAPWRGRSGLNLYADFVMETDAIVGRVLDTLETTGATENTLVVFASDNGCAHYIGTSELEAMGHRPSGPYRGYKSDAWDGGHRIPFIASWPGVTTPGSACSRTICLTDLMATCAELLEVEPGDNAGEDSVSLLALLRGEDRVVRESVVHHSIQGKFAIRSGRWKLVLCAGSGGWTAPTDKDADAGGLPPVQLYDMQTDPGEQSNLQGEHPDVVERLTRLLHKLVADGRSTPGPAQANDVPIDIWKRDPPSQPAKGEPSA